ncbi:MAG: molecular chaperone DnaJ [Gammaproteobacteria bacterium]|nr:molecular chaperone DnaJ [Gammaproteobacteria bacterium]HJP36864.1 molecular chaperone DnaJ [Gammaproteobacteria bacterium]
MHPYILLLLLGAVTAAVVWQRNLPEPQRTQARNRLLLYGGIGLLVLLLVTGKLHPLVAALAALVPVVQRLLTLAQAANAFKSFRKRATGSPEPAPGQTSDVETQFLRMSLDHDSGELDGVVLKGPFQGRRLNELKLEDLLALLATCRSEDPKSAAVLETYLDRIHGDAWRDAEPGDRQQATSDGGPPEMSLKEARRILEVETNATREDIIAAHRRLMQKMHPDRGGSTFLAAKINQAKETLLNC